MKIVYMHHAERERNTHAAWGTPERTFDEITDLGRRQAELLAERLRNEKITAIITSPYTRCRHTAEIINHYHHLDIVEDERFNEIQKNEEWESLLKRNMAAIDDIVRQYEDDDIIICVTSGVNISAFICYTYHIAPSNYVPWTQAADLSPVVFNIKK